MNAPRTPNIRQAVQAATGLLEAQDWRCAPVDPFELAKRLSIVVQGRDLDGSFSGCLMLEGNTFGILYSTSIPSDGFQRFTIAHELGHHQLVHHHSALFAGTNSHFSKSNFTSNLWYETEADSFAAELLMPQSLFLAEIRNHCLGSSAVKGLAQTFRTSWTSTAIRYAQLTPDPVAIVVSEGDRVCYCFLSEPMRRVGARYVERGIPVPRSSATFRLNRDPDRVSHAEQMEGRSLLATWFDGVPDDLEVDEDVIGLGRYGKTLTLLHTTVIPDPDEEDQC